MILKIQNVGIQDLEAQENKLPKIYLCDPSKNKDCKKTGCYLNGGDCRHTKKEEYKAEYDFEKVCDSLDWLNRMADRWTMHQNDYYNEQTERAYQIVKDYIRQKEKLQND